MRIEIDDPLPDPLPDDLDLPIEDLEELTSWFWLDDPTNTLFFIVLEAYKRGLKRGLAAGSESANRGL